MIETLLKLIGISDALAQRVEDVQWLWARPAVWWVGLVLLLPVGWFIARRHRQALPYVAAPLRGVLTGCRVGVLLLLVFVLGGPQLRLTEPVTEKPVLAVAIDASASMDLPAGPYEPRLQGPLALAAGLATPSDDANGDADGGQTDEAATVEVDAELRKRLINMPRAELLRHVLTAQQARWFLPLRDRFDVRVYRFGREIRPGSLTGAEELDLGAADTALGEALEAMLAEAGGRELAGIVLFSDGRSTAGPDPLAVAQHHQSAGSAAPVWAVPVGSPTPPADVSLLDVLAPARVAKGDRAALVATIASQGFAGREVLVTLHEGERELDRQVLVLRDAGRQQVQLAFDADVPGAKLLTVDVAAVEGEPVRENNRQTVALDVDAQRWSVLYLEGYPRWDFRFLDHALRRDPGLDVQVVMEAALRADGVAASELPTAARLPEDAAGFAEYHAVIVGDVSTDLLPRRLQEQLAKAVREEGLGLIVQAGPEHMPHAFADGPLDELLPVTLDPFDGRPGGEGGAAGEDDGPGVMAPAYAPFRMDVTATGSIHPALRLYDSATKNRETWSRMPPFYWTAAADEARPGATVLAEVDSANIRRPVIAEHFAGRGRVMVIGTDGTYRWRRNIGDHLFYRFWGQALRHVARSRDRTGDVSWMQVYPPRVEPGEMVAVELYAVDEDARPRTDERVSVQVRHGGSAGEGAGEVRTVWLERAGAAGHYRGRWRVEEAGEYQVVLPREDEPAIVAAVQAAASGRELLRPAVDRDTLGTLGEITGGGLIELHELATLPERLEGEPTTITRVHEDELWDNWLTLVLLVGLYCTDVFVRRLAGVV